MDTALGAQVGYACTEGKLMSLTDCADDGRWCPATEKLDIFKSLLFDPMPRFPGRSVSLRGVYLPNLNGQGPASQALSSQTGLFLSKITFPPKIPQGLNKVVLV